MVSLTLVLVLGTTGAFGSVFDPEAVAKATNPAKKVCFPNLDCFDTGDPWSRRRQLPPLERPHRDTTLLYFYSRTNPERAHLFNSYPDISTRGIQFDGKKPTEVIIHNHPDNATIEWIHNLKYLYLLELDANVLLVDYSHACKKGFLQCTSNSRVVGRLIARFLKHLIEKNDLQPWMIHLTGHGLGAQIASYVAKDIPGISRLTALDPQRLYFEGEDIVVRLDKSDANFVEVLHTNAIPYTGYGMVKPHGHVDFYFNDGGNQPGCALPPGFLSIQTMKDFFSLPSQYPKMRNLCNQNRAFDYLIEAYNSFSNCIFFGHKLPGPPTPESNVITFWKIFKSYFCKESPQITPCTDKDCISLGYETVNSPLRGVFVVKTNPFPPYCVSEPSYPLLGLNSQANFSYWHES